MLDAEIPVGGDDDVAMANDLIEIIGADGELGADVAQPLGQEVGDAELEATEELGGVGRVPGYPAQTST